MCNESNPDSKDTSKYSEVVCTCNTSVPRSVWAGRSSNGCQPKNDGRPKMENGNIPEERSDAPMKPLETTYTNLGDCSKSAIPFPIGKI